jgi:hypothetical protein
MKMHSDEISQGNFVETLKITAKQLNFSLDKCQLIISEIANNTNMKSRWKRYQDNFKFANGISFSDTITALRYFCYG